MASIKKDPVSGQSTTGHEWDGIRELNTPLPKWWVYVFWATVVWALAYCIVMPAWPGITGYTTGVMGYSSRAEFEKDVQAQRTERSAWTNRINGMSVEEIVKDRTLMNYAVAGGRIAFGDNCAPCHGTGGVGLAGAYPRLADDEWIWGGTLADIEQTIKFGVRNANPASHQSEMPRFGADNLLTKAQIDLVSEYVLSLSRRAPATGTPGAALFAENCAGCHQEDGSGSKDAGAPALNNVLWLYRGDRDGIASQIASPRHGSMPAWSERLDDATVKMLTVYLHSLGGGQ